MDDPLRIRKAAEQVPRVPRLNVVNGMFSDRATTHFSGSHTIISGNIRGRTVNVSYFDGKVYQTVNQKRLSSGFFFQNISEERAEKEWHLKI